MNDSYPLLEPWSWDDLARQLDIHRSRGQKIVFSNGVFDLIHPGHIRYLQAAAKLGDVLVVALNSDSSVKRLKGSQRPVLPQHERVKIMASLAMVNYVTLFEQDTPLEVISCLKPDVLVKGGDYAIEEIVGRDVVEANGGVVKTLKFVAGASSTNIIERIIASSNQHQ